MARQRLMLRFARWHIWLGWLVGFPILMWLVTGLVMIARPIEDVRGDGLRAEPLPVQTEGLVLPRFDEPTSGIELAQQASGPVWIVETSGGGRYRYDARTGGVLPPVIESEARQIARTAYAGDAALETVRYVPGDEAPIELRSPLNTWQLYYADGTNLYVEASTGQLLAVRTGWWRVYDVAWALHIMDLETRENSRHPIILIFATLSVFGATLGCVLLFRRRKAKR